MPGTRKTLTDRKTSQKSGKGSLNPQSRGKIIVRGARVHNLKNVSLELPRNKLIVFTGVSGSGKSSLAFDTIYAEGQRRFVESLSSYARQFLERMDKPDVDSIQGISPAIAIEQKTTGRNPRSTVGTSTEIYDYLRLLFARVGKTICSNCGNVVQRDTVGTVLDRLAKEPSQEDGLKLYVMFPLHDHPGASLKQELENLKKQGFFRVFYKNELIDLSEQKLNRSAKKHELMIIVDRIIYRSGGVDARLTDSLETAFTSGEGHASIHLLENKTTILFNQHFACASCELQYEEPDPRLFSFNNPFGACPTCQGFGKSVGIDMDLVIPDQDKSLREGAVSPWTMPKFHKYLANLCNNASKVDLRIDEPYRLLTAREKNLVLNGAPGFDGIMQFFKHAEEKIYKIYYRIFLSRYRGFTLCAECGGSRLRKAALNIKVGNKNVHDVVRMSIDAVEQFFMELTLTAYEEEVGRRILTELRRRLRYLVGVGIGYLTLDRLSSTLSGGETQRINLATALGSSLVGSLYVLDEPSIGLHPRDTEKLITIMKSLRDIGNTVIVVEHDTEMMNAADLIVDMGPLAGELGGEIIFQGNIDQIKAHSTSLTGKYLSGKLSIPIPKTRRVGSGKRIQITGAREHNLKSIDVEIPLNKFVCVTGVSGSGKSTLVHGILYPAVQRFLGLESGEIGAHKTLLGMEHIGAIELVDQSPIGKTPRSNPTTYIKAFDLIRELFSKMASSKIRNYTPGYFSFNVSGGRCEGCEGSGIQTIEMQFLADLELTCEVCNGKRYKKEVLAIRYHEKNIDEILQLTVSEAIKFFGSFAPSRSIANKLRVLEQVGMGYVRLGQSATTLSGGEAQRVKLASHVSDHTNERHTLYIFDEPTTGLHTDDISKLLDCFNALVERGNTVLTIEHNMEVIKCADWVIDLGPEAGDKGGNVVAVGLPEEIAANKKSYTGKFLRKYLSQ